MHGHSSDSINAVIQFIQMENVLKILLNGQSVGGGHLNLCFPNQNVPPVPPIIAAPAKCPPWNSADMLRRSTFRTEFGTEF